MKHIIVFSGGFDSSYLIQKVIKSLPSLNKLYLVSFDNDMVDNVKNKIEAKARKTIVDYYKLKYPYITFDYHTIKISGIRTLKFKSGNIGMSQPIMWASTIFPILEDGDIVYFGYIKNDNAAWKMDSVKKMLDGMSELQRNYEYHKVEYKFPLLHMDKKDILTSIYKECYPLLSLCVTCEEHEVYGNERECGKCNPCRHLKCALIEASLHEPEHSDFWNSMLLSRFGIKFSYEEINKDS